MKPALRSAALGAALLAAAGIRSWQSDCSSSSNSFAAAVISPRSSRDDRSALAGGPGPAAIVLSREHQSQVMKHRRGQESAQKTPRPALGYIVQIKRGLHIGRYPRMWWERWVGPANLDRVSLRLAGMDTYAIVASVLLQVILGLYGSIPVPDKDAPRKTQLMFEAQMALLTVAVLCSTFTMVIFLLNKVYCATALGMWKDVSYETFLNKTGKIRADAFWSLILALSCFMGAFAINVLNAINNRRGIIIGVMTVLGAGYMLRELSSMMEMAKLYVFK
eukprot:TRINITY_DN59063_c0_g1_i1.p1 TRINITY_DN59063_c0_g1~~TRINITY_DN59063_c0_g1_i1.p1  ORF type:complete len:288 (+),score=46.44 TRINITY_DN59063_c0_g1_i1:34-864(+)